MLTEIDYRVRLAIYAAFAEGGIPLAATLASKLRLSQAALHECYERLHAARAVVVDPRTREVTMALPFSASPTPFRVQSLHHTWYANCAWDAFGIPNLIGCDAVLTTTCPDCEGPIVHRIEHRELVDAHGVVHFLVPAARWWENIGFT